MQTSDSVKTKVAFPWLAFLVATAISFIAISPWAYSIYEFSTLDTRSSIFWGWILSVAISVAVVNIPQGEKLSVGGVCAAYISLFEWVDKYEKAEDVDFRWVLILAQVITSLWLLLIPIPHITRD